MFLFQHTYFNHPPILLSKFFQISLLGLFLSISSISFAADKIAIQKNNITVWQTSVPNSKMLGFKAKTVIDANMQRVLSAIMDVEHSNEWIPRTKKATSFENELENNMPKVYIVLDLPFPLADRELPIASKLSKDSGTVTLTNYLTNIASKPHNKDYVRMTEYKGTWILEPINDNKQTALTISGYANPAGAVPAWVANMFVTDQPYDMLLNLKQQVKKSRYNTPDKYAKLP